MANTSRLGMWPVGTLTGSPWSASVRRIQVDGSTNICIGDPVTMQANGIGKLMATANTNDFFGVVVGVEAVNKTTNSVASTSSPNLERNFAPKGTTLSNVMVVVDPYTIYEVLGNMGAATNMIGTAVNIIAADNQATTPTKTSTCYADTLIAHASTTAVDGVFRVIGLQKRVGDDEEGYAADSNGKVLVVLHKGIFKAGSAGI